MTSHLRPAFDKGFCIGVASSKQLYFKELSRMKHVYYWGFCGFRLNTITMLQDVSKGAFTLGRFCAQFHTKLARLLMKKKYFFSKMCKLNAKSRAKIANVNAP